MNESAVTRQRQMGLFRAVLNERCQPYKLPPDKYARWRQMTLEFDPSD